MTRTHTLEEQSPKLSVIVDYDLPIKRLGRDDEERARHQRELAEGSPIAEVANEGENVVIERPGRGLRMEGQRLGLDIRGWSKKRHTHTCRQIYQLPPPARSFFSP